MEYLIGFVLCFAVAGLAAITGLERDRALYTTVLIINASNYVLFAVIGALELWFLLPVAGAATDPRANVANWNTRGREAPLGIRPS